VRRRHHLRQRVLAVTAWGLWKQRQIVVPASIITSVLLLCDAWFDLLTANGHRDLIVSAASALFGELPLATMLILISIRALHVGARAARALQQDARRELLDRTLIWNQRHLMTVLREYEDFYNTHRPHRTLKQAAPLRPLPDGVSDLDHFRVQRRDRAGGVLHEYHLVA
jgi:hypothetical protein